MTTFSYADGIAVWKLVYYTFALVGSIIVSWRHGFGKNSGWIYLTIFSAIRIVNSSAELATISSSNSTVATIAIITGFLGLSPLLLASLGLISRIYYSMLKTPWNFIFSLAVLKIVQTPAGVGLILCIVGATSAETPEDISKQATLQAGVILYLIVYILLVLLTIIAAIGRRVTGRGEDKLLLAVALSLPFLLIRVVYSLLSTFSGNQIFNPLEGSTTAELCLAFIEEMIVVLIYIWVGLKSSSIPESDGKDGAKSRLMRRAVRGDFDGRNLGFLSLGAAVIGEIRHAHKSQQPDMQEEILPGP